MYNKTTSTKFEKYGLVYADNYLNLHKKIKMQTVKIKHKKVHRLISYNKDIFLRVKTGIAMICITQDGQSENFVIHRVIQIYKNTPFNFIAITRDAEIEIQIEKKLELEIFPLENPMEHVAIVPSFNVLEIFACYYQIKNNGYFFEGERHNYWELTYVDYGQLITTIEGNSFTLDDHQLILYGPGQYHDQHIITGKNCSYFTIMFNLNIKNYDTLLGHVFKCEKHIYDLMQQIVSSIDDHSAYSKDLLLAQLQTLIIRLLMKLNQPSHEFVVSTPMQQHFEDELLSEILIFLNGKISKSLGVDDICREFSMSRSSLQHLFKKNLDVSPKSYFNDLKLAYSKILIREQQYNISEISEKLGFTSIHYFSRKFKQTFNITPTEYAKSIYKQ